MIIGAGLDKIGLMTKVAATILKFAGRTVARIIPAISGIAYFVPPPQVNALIMGPAGYRVADFMKAGGIMTVLFLTILTVMLNLIY